MSHPLWLDQLSRELKRRSLPEAYCARLLEELTDHQLDLEEQQMSKDALASPALEHSLGDPQHIAAQAAKACRRHFAQRWPVLCFIVGPLLGFPISLVALLVIGLNGAEALFAATGWESPLQDPSLANLAIHTFAWTLRVLPFAAGAFFFAYLGKRSQQDWRWSLLAVLIITLLAISFHAQVADRVGTTPGQFSLGLSLPMSSPLAYLQALCPLSIAVLVVLKRKRQSPLSLAG